MNASQNHKVVDIETPASTNLNQDQEQTESRGLAATRTNSAGNSTAFMENQEITDESSEPEKFKAGFFDRDPETSKHRAIYLKTLIGGSALTILVIFGVLSIYWGSLWKVTQNVHHLNGWIVDFDGGAMGQTVRETLMNMTGSPETLTWEVIDASRFPNGPADLEQAVLDEHCWVGVSVNPGVSNALNSAIATADGSYNGTLAVTAYAEEARNENSYPLILVPIIEGSLTKAAQTFATQNSERIASNSSLNLQRLLTTAPGTVTNPMFFTLANIRPFNVPVATAVDFVGLIYLLILSFIIAMMNFNARVVRSGLNHHLRTRSLMGVRLLSPPILYFFISFFYSLLSLAFKVPFRRAFGGWGFIIFWMMNWMGMLALGLAMEAMITLLTPAFVPFFLVLWIISNVSVCFFPIPLLPGVFKYGYAMPFYNVSRTVRAIVFNTRNQIGLNFGVQFAWIAVSLITIPALQLILRRRLQRQHARQMEERKRAYEKEMP